MKILLILFFLISSILPVNALEYKNVFDLNDNSDIIIDGNYSDWNSLPISYEFNWDNSSNCWYNGYWFTDDNGEMIQYKTPEGTYDNIVRHAMQLYCDGEYVYLHIKIASVYESGFNGEDYNFYINGERASYQIVTEDNTLLTNYINNINAGTYEIKVKHRDSSWSYHDVPNSSAYITKYENNKNAELEIKIPLSEMQKQNPAINIETMSVIEFFTPNLMYRNISLAGSSSGPYVVGVLSLSIAIFSYVLWRKK